MLTQDFFFFDTVDAYANFVGSLTWFRMYCAGNMGGRIEDYSKGLEALKSSYEKLFLDPDSEPTRTVVSDLLESIQSVLKSRQSLEEKAAAISSLIWSFQKERESVFRKWYVEELTYDYNALIFYPADLYRSVKGLLNEEKGDEAIVVAFKYLDNYLQTLLNVSPHQFHGEDLINHAFAPNAGALQLGTHPNEQVGLRNFVSGANALFRNPSAHRFTAHGRDLFVPSVVVAIVAVIVEIAKDLARKSKSAPTP